MVVLLTVRPSDRLTAQEDPILAHPMGDPSPGRRAPAFSLPYVTAEGPGPAAQPFVLQAELGRVVVLAFCAGTADRAAASLLRAFATRYDSLFVGDVVVAAVMPGRADSLQRVAESNGLSYKLLPDSIGNVRRLFGVGPNDLAVYVIGLDGRVSWRDKAFNPFLAASYARLHQAIRKAGMF
jgi:peroxiredoxin